MAWQHLRQYLAWITLIAVLFTWSHVPDSRAQGNVVQPTPGERTSPNPPPTPGESETPSPPPPATEERETPSPPPVPTTGVIFGRVTATAPPTTGPKEGSVPGPVPGGSLVPVAVARVGIAPVGSDHVWWVVTSVDGSFAIRVPAGTYRVTLEAHPSRGVAKSLPATVTVEAGQQTRFDIHLDSGIR